MSYDLAVFEPSPALRDRGSFMEWYESRTEWEDGLDYQQPSNATARLQAWYRDMIQTFPPMNGPDSPPMEDAARWEWAMDYSIGSDIIYVGFSWSRAELAYERTKELAAKHVVGFFDASGSEGAAWFPSAGGALEVVHQEPSE
jgi:hypothetical protein